MSRRRRIEGRCGSAVRHVTTDLLSGRGRVCPRWLGRPFRSSVGKGAHKLNFEAMAFVERHLEGDGAIHARALAEQLESGRYLGPPRSIERAIARKNRRANRCRRPFRASLDCGLRGPTRCGDRRHPRAEGAAALRFHGMLHGLPVLVKSTAAIDTTSGHQAQRMDALPAGDEFVRLLANLVLRTHSARPCLLIGIRRLRTTTCAVMPSFTCGNRRYARSLRTPRVRSASTLYVSAPCRWVGP